MKMIVDRVANLVAGRVQQQDAAKTAFGVFAEEINRGVPDVARIVGRMEAETGAIPELLRGLTDQISRWRAF